MKGLGLKSVLLATCASFAVAVPAHAQDAAAAAEENVIVVTAQNRAQDVTDVPIAIEVVDAEALQDAGVTDFRDLARVAPVLNITQDAQYTRVAVRGVGTNSNDEAQDQSVAVNIDGEYINRPNILNLALFDLDRVEVLRGPQGTLYGRNATGGAINFITRKPGRDFGVNASATYGNYNHILLEAGVDVPFGDIGGLRVAGIYNKRDGFFYHPNRAAAGRTDVRSGTADNHGARASLRLTPTDALTIDLAGEYVHNENIIPAFASYNFDAAGQGPGAACTLNGFVDVAPLVTGGQCIPLATNALASIGSRTVFDGPLPVYALNPNLQDSYAARGSLEYDFGPAVLSYIGGFRTTSGNTDVNLPTYVFLEYLNEVETQSHELRLSSGPDSPFQWQLGGFYFNETISSRRGLYSAFAAGGAFINFFNRDTDSKSYAGFAQVEVPVTEQIALVGGLRYTIDERSGVYGNYNFRPSNPPTAPTFPAQTIRNLLQENEKLTWLAGVNYKPNPDTLIYAKVSTGYKAGGFDSINSYEPESNLAYEVGGKFSLGDRGQHQINTSAFYYDYTDLQASILLNPAIGGQVFNAGGATIYGAEVEGTFKLGDHDTLSASVNYLNATYDELFASYAIFDTVTDNNNGIADLDPGAAVVRPNFAGNKVPQSPEFTATLGYDHVFDFGDRGFFTFNAFSRFKSEYFLTLFNYRDNRQEAFTQTDVSLKYQPVSEKWEVQAFIRNLEDYQPIAYSNFVSAGNDDVFDFAFAQPRTYGIRVGIDF